MCSFSFGFGKYAETIRREVTTIPAYPATTDAQERALLPSVDMALEGTRVSHTSMTSMGNIAHHVSPQAQDGELLQRTTDVSQSTLHSPFSVANETSSSDGQESFVWIDENAIPKPRMSWEDSINQSHVKSLKRRRNGISSMMKWVQYDIDTEHLQMAQTKLELINTTLEKNPINLGTRQQKKLDELRASLT